MTPTLLEFAEKTDISQITTYINIELDLKINAVKEKYMRLGQNMREFNLGKLEKTSIRK